MVVPLLFTLAAHVAAGVQANSPGRESLQQKVVLSYFHDVLDGRRIGLLDELLTPTVSSTGQKGR